jgi:PAS domain S-box-containing protein
MARLTGSAALLKGAPMRRAIFTGILVLMLSQTGASQPTEQRHVLVIHSYHAGFVWTDRMAQGIRDGLLESFPHLQLHHEFMDTKRHFEGLDSPAVHSFAQMLEARYAERPLSAVVVCDDNAFRFAMDHYERLFAGLPIVFCGVNHFAPALVPSRAPVTGIIESVDRQRTIDLALELHPQADRVFLITDQTTSGAGNQEMLAEAEARYGDNVDFLFASEDGVPTMEQLLDQLRRLDQRTVVLHVDFFRDGDDRYFDPDVALRMISDASPAAVYCSADMYMPHGAVGGYVVDSYEHGLVAGQTVERLLSGTPIDQLPIRPYGGTHFMFDQQQLAEFSIDRASLPANSTIINQPVSLYDEYRPIFWAAGITIVFLLALVFMLLWAITRRRAAERLLRESEARLRLLVDSADDLVLLFTPDGRIEYYNGPDHYGLAAENVVGCTPEQVTDAESARHLVRFIQQVGQTGQPVTIEARLRWGRQNPWLLQHIYPVHDGSGRLAGVGLIGRNTTALRQSRQALAESETRYRTLFEEALNPIFIVSSDGRYVDANRAALEFTERRRPQLIGREVWEFADPQEIDKIRAEHQPFDQRRTVETEYHINGTVKTLLLNVIPVERDGTTVLFGIGQDITDRKRAEQELRHSLRELQAINAIARAAARGDQHLIAQAATDAVAELLEVDYARLWINEGDDLELAASWGLSETANAAVKTVPRTGDLVETRLVEQVPDCPTGKLGLGDDDLPLGSYLFQPIFSAGQMLGALWLASAEPGRLNAATVDELALIIDPLAAGLAVARSRQSEARAAKNLRREVTRRSVLLRELNHRVRNNLAMVIALLQMTRTTDAAAADALQSASRRIEAMAKVHGMLSRTEWHDLSLHALINDVCHPLVSRLGRDGTRLEVNVEPRNIQITPKQANAVALILQELTAGALRAQTTGGALEVRANRQPDGALHVAMVSPSADAADPTTQDPADVLTENRGLELVRGLTEHDLQGNFTLRQDSTGTVAELKIP